MVVVPTSIPARSTYFAMKRIALERRDSRSNVDFLGDIQRLRVTLDRFVTTVALQR